MLRGIQQRIHWRCGKGKQGDHAHRRHAVKRPKRALHTPCTRFLCLQKSGIQKQGQEHHGAGIRDDGTARKQARQEQAALFRHTGQSAQRHDRKQNKHRVIAERADGQGAIGRAGNGAKACDPLLDMPFERTKNRPSGQSRTKAIAQAHKQKAALHRPHGAAIRRDQRPKEQGAEGKNTVNTRHIKAAQRAVKGRRKVKAFVGSVKSVKSARTQHGCRYNQHTRPKKALCILCRSHCFFPHRMFISANTAPPDKARYPATNARNLPAYRFKQ